MSASQSHLITAEFALCASVNKLRKIPGRSQRCQCVGIHTLVFGARAGRGLFLLRLQRRIRISRPAISVSCSERAAKTAEAVWTTNEGNQDGDADLIVMFSKYVHEGLQCAIGHNTGQVIEGDTGGQTI